MNTTLRCGRVATHTSARLVKTYDFHNAARAGWIDKFETQSTIDARRGLPFGSAGIYQIVSGSLYGKLNPGHAANAAITGIKRAPVGADGSIDYSMNFVILRPKIAANAKRVLLYSTSRMGRCNGFKAYDEASKRGFEVGNEGYGLLMCEGYTIVLSGLQDDTSEPGIGTQAGVHRATKGVDVAFAAIRDLVTFLRNDYKDAHGNANPLNDLTFDIAMMEGGGPEPGGVAKDFLRTGFNDNTRGGKVFDAIVPFGR